MKIFTPILCLAALVATGTQAAAQTLYDNFENTRLVSYPIALGVFTHPTANPASSTVNSSPSCALYTRDAGQQYAVIVVKPNNTAMADVSAYVAGTKRISMKFRSPAVGTVVEAVLQNSRLNTANYPTGKFGGDFRATTTVANAWETLTFTYIPGASGGFDPAVLPTDVDQMVLLVAPNTKTGETYYIDDLMGPELLAPVITAGAVSQLYDNYEGTRVIKYIAYKSSGGLNADTLNPAPTSTANPSTKVARYTRSANQYDVLVVHPQGAALADVTPFKNNTVRMTLKVYSTAPGIPFQITLQDSTVAAANNYPAGRNSEYTATTTATNAWETLTFNYVNTPSATSNTSVNEIVLLIAPNTFARRRLYLDDWTGPSLVGFVTAARTVKTATAAFAPAYPNPTSGLTNLPFSLQKPAVVSLAVYDNLGRRVATVVERQTRPAGQFTAELNAAQLAPGLYTCRLTVDGVALTRPLSVE
ncbi:T9SS type A sorting domain-containing protein [Hymenobacter sp. BT683]|uniref:T9SS type A sorting domain-containing protein n=1 Tax=Hymenobacter jeongseonensis TaxID=2791027 RepID=A0ABS0IL81_9BACT|nr:T9SS type A sorting domain-containing protein [Hymenobacter jeongseonensis]MBF9239096.1 T9SS type A sorting domain-containing protein [Hymenobacter jeongseonensis]